MHLVRKTGAALCGAVLLLGACGGSSSKPSASGSTATTQSNSSTVAGATSTPTSSGGASNTGSDAACKLFTQSDATTLFGTAANQIPDASPATLAKSTCLWNAKPTPLLSYLLQMRIYDNPSFYSGSLPGYTPIAGIGDKAVIYVLPGGNTIMLTYQKGNTVYATSYSVHQITSGARKTAEQQKDQFIALVKQAAGR